VKPKTSGELKTWALIDGVERDVTVSWDSSPPEPDVGWAGGTVIECVEFDGDDVTEDMSNAEAADLLERVEQLLGESAEEEDCGLGDHLYDLKRDREL